VVEIVVRFNYSKEEEEEEEEKTERGSIRIEISSDID
jgi:hypothetical protein